jgi:purine-binding chemotaxis protein CheW
MRPFIQFSSRYIQKCDEFYLAFNIGEDWFAANFPKIAGFSKDFEFKRHKNKVQYISGVACLNGECLPVIDLKRKMGMAKENFKKTHKIVVIETELYNNVLKFAILYDSIGDAFEISQKNFVPSPNMGEQYDSKNIYGLYIHQDDCVFLLDFDSMFSIDDLIDIKLACAKMQKEE